MTPDEHLARAEALLTVADDLFTRGQETGDWPQQIRLTEAASCAAAIARARIDLAGELRAVAAVEEWRPLLAPDLGTVADVTPIKRPQVGDVKDCECCGTSIRAVVGTGGVVWVSGPMSRPHTCPPPEPMRAPADAPAEAPDQHPRKD